MVTRGRSTDRAQCQRRRISMKYRLAPVVGGVALAALVSACTTSPRVEVNVPPPVYSSNTVQAVPVPVGAEYGRVVNIEYFAGGVSRSGPNVPGAIVGAVAGAVIGNQIGGGSGRDAATVLGGAARAAGGSQVGPSTRGGGAGYRGTRQTDSGGLPHHH